MNKVIETLHSLRSIRKFTNKDINDEDLKDILSCAVRAANCSNRQNYSIIVIKDKEILHKLFYNSNKALVFCVDYNRIIDTAEQLGVSVEIQNIKHFVSGSTDTVLAAQNAVIAAKSLGIDSVFTTSIFRYDLEEIFDLLNLPEKYCFPLVALCLGYAEEEPTFKKGRLDDRGVIHYGKYHKLSEQEISEIIEQYDDYETHLASLPPSKWREMGFNHFLEWAYGKWFNREPKRKAIEFEKKLYETSFFESLEP